MSTRELKDFAKDAVKAQMAQYGQANFPEDELERLRAQYLNAIRQEKSRPLSMALRLLPGLLYGEGHAYAQPLTGSGTEESITTITAEDLADWHSTWFRPNNATLVLPCGPGSRC